MHPLSLYTVFHLNISFSSIEEEQRAHVVDKCYWPLLKLARKYNLPLGIELTGYTLESIAAIDLSWVIELRNLILDGTCELIGSGYAQIISPLIPAAVNTANLRIGAEIYSTLLGTRPAIALVNEQAYASGLIELYLDAGYSAIVMDWDNPACYNPTWKSNWRYYPQYACSRDGKRIALIWNNSIAFQKFQRYAHREIELDEYLDYIASHCSETARALPLYGNDVEIFDFRPGRFHTEAGLGSESEWERIEKLFDALSDDKRFKLLSPGNVLPMIGLANAGNDLHLESSACPVPVKKQGKYNVTRWAVTGRADFSINSACWRIYEELKDNRDASDNEWKELCYLWSSDFRTHITDKRWTAYCNQLTSYENLIQSRSSKNTLISSVQSSKASTTLDDVKIQRQGRYLVIETDTIRIRFNCYRGIAIDALWFKNISTDPLIGTIQHGYYDDISLGADFYSGHLILETPGKFKVTDLNPVEVETSNNGRYITISAAVSTTLGTIHKWYQIDKEKSLVELNYTLGWNEIPMGSLRLGHITVIPSSCERDSLFYRTHNGGRQPETFFLKNTEFDHGAAVSFLVSANCAVGMTEKYIEVGDRHHYVRLSLNEGMEASVGMVTYRETKETYFLRLALSVAEMDDTSRKPSQIRVEPHLNFSLTLTAGPQKDKLSQLLR